MMKRYCFTLLVAFILIFTAQAEIRIKSSSDWYATITGGWTNHEGLQYENTVYGDTYYNPGWQDMKKRENIETKSVYRYFYLKPDYKRNWTFAMAITNINAEKGHSYFSSGAPNLKQSASDIYWAISIGYKENGISRQSHIWISRSAKEYLYQGLETYDSQRFIQYCVDNGGWKKSEVPYPSCSPNEASTFTIETYVWGKTYIKWGNWSITDFPVYMEELTYIQIYVGTQAKVQIGKPSAFGFGVKSKAYDAEDLLNQGNYTLAKQKLYKTDGVYYEKPALNLACCYLMLNEYDNAIAMCNALITYHGETINRAYAVRGLAKEGKQDYQGALNDYRMAGEIASDQYNRLSNFVKGASLKQQRQHQSSSQTNRKPPLTK